MKHLPTAVTQTEQQTLRTFIKHTKDSHAKDRARAVLKRMQGYRRDEIARFFEVNKDTVSNWITWYRKHGSAGLVSKPQPGNHAKLTKAQKETIQQLVTEKLPKDLGYDVVFWDVPALQRYVRETFQVTYQSDRSYHRLFAFCGLSYHKPAKQDRKRRENAVKQFEERLRKKGELVETILSSSSKMKSI